MGCWILEPTTPGPVPGTTQYFDDPSHPERAEDESHRHLKTVDVNGAKVILVPQPSHHRDDPLNWPTWRKDLITFLLSLTAIFATAQGSILASNTVVITLAIHRQFSEVALLTGYFLMGCGAGAVFFVPSGRVWGKRHAFLIGLVVMEAATIWACFVGDNYGQFIAARIIQGIGCAPFETLVNAAIGDLYFLHERGVRMAFTNLAVFGGAFFTPIVVGKITRTMGWEWPFIFSSIFLGVCLPMVFFFCPETAYLRKGPSAVQTADPITGDKDTSGSGSASLTDNNTALAQSSGHTDTPAANDEAGRAGAVDEKPRSRAFSSWAQGLKVFNGRKTRESFLVLLLRPFPLLFHPAFLWACLIQGTMIGWTVFIGVIIGVIFQGPPYWWGEDNTGYTYVGPFVGAILGFVIAGALSDWSARFMTKRNNGVYEPEFRILLVIPMFIIGEIGLYGFGLSASKITSSESVWQVPVFFFGLEVCAMVIGAVSK